jgi:hypothetical protein
MSPRSKPTANKTAAGREAVGGLGQVEDVVDQ